MPLSMFINKRIPSRQPNYRRKDISLIPVTIYRQDSAILVPFPKEFAPPRK